MSESITPQLAQLRHLRMPDRFPAPTPEDPFEEMAATVERARAQLADLGER